MRNTSTDGDYLSLITVWDCGIDGVETDLSLCLTHGASAAAIPTVQWEAIEINGMNTRKGAKKKKKKGEEERKRGKMCLCLKKKKAEISSIQSASLYCPNIYNALSLSVVLSHSHSLHWNPHCHKKNKRHFITCNDLVITETYWGAYFTAKFKTPQHVYWISYINSSILGLLFPVRSIRSHFGGEWLTDSDERGKVALAYISRGTRPKC